MRTLPNFGTLLISEAAAKHMASDRHRRRARGPWVLKYAVYTLTEISSDLVYVGFSGNLANRIMSHLGAARRGVDHRLYDALRTSGESGFRLDLLSSHDSQHEGLVAEKFAIIRLDADIPSRGFNRPLPGAKPSHGVGRSGFLDRRIFALASASLSFPT